MLAGRRAGLDVGVVGLDEREFRPGGQARGRAIQPSGEPLPEIAEPGADPFERAVESREVAALLATLPVEQRAAVVLVDTQGMSYASAAAVLEIPAGTLASRLSSAREKLRREFVARGLCLPSSDQTEVPS